MTRGESFYNVERVKAQQEITSALDERVKLGPRLGLRQVQDVEIPSIEPDAKAREHKLQRASIDRFDRERAKRQLFARLPIQTKLAKRKMAHKMVPLVRKSPLLLRFWLKSPSQASPIATFVYCRESKQEFSFIEPDETPCETG